MMIPLINPARPPKKWFYRTVHGGDVHARLDCALVYQSEKAVI